MYERGGNYYETALDEEGDSECSTSFGIDTSCLREEQAAHQEEEYRGEAFEPGVGVVNWLIGSAKSEEDGVTSLHAHETAPGIEGAAVAEAGNETACYDRNVGMFLTNVSLEVIRHTSPIALGVLRGSDRSLRSRPIFYCW